MNDEWLTDRLSYSGTLQASGDDLREAWRLENEVPANPAIGMSHFHNWIRGVRTLKVNMQMAAGIVAWHPTELLSNRKEVHALLDAAPIDSPWAVTREDRDPQWHAERASKGAGDTDKGASVAPGLRSRL